MEQTPRWLWLPGRLPGLNEMLHGASRVIFRAGKTRRVTVYGASKSQLTRRVAMQARKVLRPAQLPWEPGILSLLLVCDDRRSDPSNLDAGARKIILDGLCRAGVISGDGWAHDLGGVYYPHCASNGPHGVLCHHAEFPAHRHSMTIYWQDVIRDGLPWPGPMIG